MAHEITDPEELRIALAQARTIVVLGAHVDPGKAAHYVPRYLVEQGYRVIPVNPRFEGALLFGEVVRGHLSEVGEPCDILDVFRRGEDLPMHLDEILAMPSRPKLVWLQSGIVNVDVAARLVEEGIDVVQDRCTLVEHRRFGFGRGAQPSP